jgi:anti-sigma-K factor RskA
MTPPNDDHDRLAAEHVLGTLEGDEARRAERLLESDRGFAAAVARWQDRLADLDRTAAPVPAPERLWQRIEADLAPRRAPAPASPPPEIVPDPRSVFTALWRSLRFWRLASLAGAAAAVVLAVGLAVLSGQRARTPVLVAVLLTEANRPAALVNTYADGRTVLVPLEGLTVPPGKALEVWTQVDPARGPVSVGLLDRAYTMRLRLDQLPRPGPNQFFAISLEPATGSPTGQPTGPVLMKGTTSVAL